MINNPITITILIVLSIEAICFMVDKVFHK